MADVAVTLADFKGFAGEAMAMGERTPLAADQRAASGRMAVAEAITNLLAAPIELPRVKLSANWMAACGEARRRCRSVRHRQGRGHGAVPRAGRVHPGGQGLAVHAHEMDGDNGATKQVTAPVSPDRDGFCLDRRCARTLTPQLVTSENGQALDTSLILIDLGEGKNRMGGSMLAQVLGQFGSEVPDCDNPEMLKATVNAVNALRAQGKLLAYHDRGDGGLWADGGRDGLCRQHRREPECGHAGDREHRRGRQPCGLR